MTSKWQTHQLNQRKTPNDKDYKMMNKLAAKNRVTTASSQYRFRQQVNSLRIEDPKVQREYIRSKLLSGHMHQGGEEHGDL